MESGIVIKLKFPDARTKNLLEEKKLGVWQIERACLMLLHDYTFWISSMSSSLKNQRNLY